MDHHYVPQFYLRAWAASDGKLWRYRRERSGLVCGKAVAPRGTAFEPDLYAVVDVLGNPAHDPQIIETEFFGKIDNDAALVHQKLCGTLPIQLTDAEQTAWALFMNSLHERSLEKLSEMDNAISRMAALVNEGLQERYPGIEETLVKLDTVQLARSSNREFMVNKIRNGTMIERLKRLRWILADRVPSRPMITTDRPVRAYDPFPGLLTMPISPTRLLLAHAPEIPQDDELHSALVNVATVHDLSVLEGCTCVYSSYQLDDGQRAALEKALPRVA